MSPAHDFGKTRRLVSPNTCVISIPTPIPPCDGGPGSRQWAIWTKWAGTGKHSISPQRSTTPQPDRLDLRPILELAEIQLRLLERKPMPFVARAEPIPNLAFIVSMPRSGTTLLEQMLDRHASIGGIGEYDGLDHVCATLTETPGWLTNPQEVPQNLIDKLRHGYVGGIDRIRRPGATHTVDKSLRCWRALPEIATVFPGAVAISIDRDPRDVATSLFLHYFNPSTYEWTSGFDTIRQVIETQRKIVEVALEILEIPSERIVYEDLVEDPAAESARVLQRMGLGMDDAVLSPENNPKGAATLSYEQVRKPINRGSIGRWKNYAWAFDSSWDRIVDEHNSRRTRSTP